MTAKQLHLFIIIALIFNISKSFSQNKVDALIDKYANYVDAPREVAFAHLNKSVYVEGEMLGFQAYVFDKVSKERSLMTSNLYCTITDDDGNVIKEKLILMLDGVANNVFNIDSTFTKNEYTFKAFTNYMLNFEEQNHFEQKFSVIYADDLNSNNQDIASKTIDLQVLPEGGHLIENVFNTIAVIAKDTDGAGIPNANIELLDQNNNLISVFKLNEYGIGKTIFKPNTGDKYSVKLSKENLNHQVNITSIKPTGLALSLSEVQGKVILKFSTNDIGLKTFGNRIFNLIVHNGGEINSVPFSLNNELEAKLAFESSNLFSGINIFTLFDENNNPILERLYFNHEGIASSNLGVTKIERSSDSITIGLSLQNYSKNSFNNLSVSVLPEKTKSYNHHNNIFSSLYIQPYIKGAVENAGSYFNDINTKTKYNLDLLLLSQGWSSYNWNNIFKGEPLLKHAFERGIDAVAEINNNSKGGTYLVHPLQNNTSGIFELSSNDKKFHQENLVPIEGEMFKSSLVKGKGKSQKPGLYVRFHPSRIPTFLGSTNVASTLSSIPQTYDVNSFNAQSWNQGVVLDEVVIESNARFARQEKLNKKSFNTKFHVVDESARISNMRLSVYLNNLGWVANETDGFFNVVNPRVTWGPTTPLVFLDDALLSDFGILQYMTLEIIDVIESDLYGNGGMGIRGSAGYIKIYTDPSLLSNRSNPNSHTFIQPFPLTFANEQTFYTPVYKFYNTTFFNEYGVIGWKPNLKANDLGYVEFKIPNTGTSELSLFIEGLVNDNELISKQLNVALD